MINITWDFIITIAVTAFITGSFNALANYFIYKLLIKHLDDIGDRVNGKHANVPYVTNKYKR